MADRVIIAWNFRNWVTIVLMAGIGMALVGLIVSFLRSNLSGSNPITAAAQTGVSDAQSLASS